MNSVVFDVSFQFKHTYTQCCGSGWICMFYGLLEPKLPLSEVWIRIRILPSSRQIVRKTLIPSVL
jgi:hypothetical protein